MNFLIGNLQISFIWEEMIFGMYIIVFWGRYYNIGAGSKEPALRVFIEFFLKVDFF